jgi:hypothetical protein
MTMMPRKGSSTTDGAEINTEFETQYTKTMGNRHLLERPLFHDQSGKPGIAIADSESIDEALYVM